jgi:hypothetical protein
MKYNFITYANNGGQAGVTSSAPPAAAGGALDAALEQLVQSLTPPPEIEARDEGIRQRMEQTMKTRWSNARVAIYGSAGSGFRVGNDSDVRASPGRHA